VNGLDLLSRIDIGAAGRLTAQLNASYTWMRAGYSAAAGGLGTKFMLNNYCEVHSFTNVDLNAQYAFTRRFSVHDSALNVFGAEPPVDMTTEPRVHPRHASGGRGGPVIGANVCRHHPDRRS
jgi:outer membrane receptor protein involved in Fe transport